MQSKDETPNVGGTNRSLDQGAPAEADLIELRDVAARLSQQALSQRCQVELDRLASPTQPTVVVAGEINKGKSSLVNALVGVPDLLPVDIDVATGSYIRVRHGVTTAATVYNAEGAGGVVIDPADLRDWVCEKPTAEAMPMIRFAEVSVPAPLLSGGVDLVDTPGLGGLNRMHAELTLSVLAQADALLYVFDVFSPLSQADVDFLLTASRSVPVVRLVMNKADVAGHIDELLQENHQVLVRHLPGVASAAITTTSARLAVNTLRRQGQLDESTDRSGVVALGWAIRHDVADACQRTRLRSADLVVAAVAADLEGFIQQALAAYDSVEESRRQLQQTRAGLKQLIAVQATWKVELRKVVELGARDVTNGLQDTAADLRRTLDRDIDVRWRRGRLARFADEVQAQLVKVSWAATQSARDALLELLRRAAEQLGVADVDIAVAEQEAVLAQQVEPAAPLTAAGLDLGVRSRMARQVLFTPIAAHGSATLLAAGIGSFFAGLVGPVLVAVSLGFTVLDYHAATVASEQREAHRHVEEVLARWHRDVRQALEDEYWATFTQTSARLEEALRLRVADSDGRVVRLQEMVDAGGQVDTATVERLRAVLLNLGAVADRSRIRTGAPPNTTLTAV